MENTFGFIVMDEELCLFATLRGDERTVLRRLEVDLDHRNEAEANAGPLRTARLRLERLHNYRRRVGEIARELFLEGEFPNIRGLVLASTPKMKLSRDHMDSRLQHVILLEHSRLGDERQAHLEQAIGASIGTIAKCLENGRLRIKLHRELLRSRRVRRARVLAPAVPTLKADIGIKSSSRERVILE
jgi:hypothetical protein